jgi:hypothetical protein
LYTSSEMKDVKQGEKDGNKHPSSQTDHWKRKKKKTKIKGEEH